MDKGTFLSDGVMLGMLVSQMFTFIKLLKLYAYPMQRLTPIIPAFGEAEAGGSLELRSLRLQ